MIASNSAATWVGRTEQSQNDQHVVTGNEYFGAPCRHADVAFLKESSFHYADLITAQFHYMAMRATCSGEGCIP
jgi:hypothetical protein